MKHLILMILFLVPSLVFADALPLKKIGQKCTHLNQCQDGNFCNGRESCKRADDGKLRCHAANKPACSISPGRRCIENEKKCVKIRCRNNNQCDDGLFCTGKRVCDTNKYMNVYFRAKNVWGCSLPKKPCKRGESCNNESRSCEDPSCIGRNGDADGDGHKDVRCKGGDDCDDRDPNRFPGNPEVCDSEGHDEDCDLSTFGSRDMDKDGQISRSCCQVQENGQKICGKDCDDNDPLVVFGFQRCIQHGSPAINVCGLGNTRCLKGLVCYEQPNGSGVCAPQN